MADPERVDADLDPTFQADADPNTKFVWLGREKNVLPNLHFFLLHNLTKLVRCNLLSNNAGGGARGEGCGHDGRGMRKEGGGV